MGISADIFSSGGGGGGTGNVVGPGSSVDGDIVVFSGTTGKIIQDTGISSTNPSFVGAVTAGSQLSLITGNLNLPTSTSASVGHVTFGGNSFISNSGVSNFFLGELSGNQTLSGTGNYCLGRFSLANLTTGAENVAIGENSLAPLTTGSFNTAVGFHAGRALNDGGTNTFAGASTGSNTISGVGNTIIGANAFIGSDGGPGLNNNTGIGIQNLENLEDPGASNCAFGGESLLNLSSGSFNIAVGWLAGNAYTGAESSNVIIGNSGVLGESNVIRIGTQGTGDQQQNKCVVAGIVGVTVSNAQTVMVDSTTGQLGVGSGSGGITEYFSAYLSAPTGNVTGDNTLFGPVIFNTVLSNTGNYNTATGVYTAPTTGQYSFQNTLAFNGGDVLTLNYISLWNGSVYSTRAFQINPVAPSSNTVTFSASITIPMTAGDTMSVDALSGGTNKNVAIFGGAPTGFAVTSTFSGFRVGT